MNESISAHASHQISIAQMVKQQVRTWEVFDEDVLDVMQAVPRAAFLPEKFAPFAYTDSSFQLYPEFLLPSPSVQGKILQALAIESDASVLQIGAGCGYLSACLAELGGFINTVDKDEQALQQLVQTCATLNITNINTVLHSYENLFAQIENQYDAIVMQQAMTSIPTELKQALRINGVAVLFTGDSPIIRCVRIERLTETEWLQEALFETIVSDFPLSNKEKVTFAF